MNKLFGTDGIRGIANRDLSASLALRIAQAATTHLIADRDRPIVVVGRDPRISGDMLEAAVMAGITSCGATVIRVGTLPTPAIAYLTQAYQAHFGIMISASHNPMADNGIKIFTSTGHKLSPEEESVIETLLDHPRETFPIGSEIGRILDAQDAQDCYLRHLSDANHTRFDGLSVVVDCANGAASIVAPRAYRAAGAKVFTINNDPNGININEGCGSTHLEMLQRKVLEYGADLGLAHDGDADRCLAVDAKGQIIDGDIIMAILALGMHSQGKLTHDTVVVTTMTNFGFHQAMHRLGITVCTTDVGDRNISQQLIQGGYSLGGEQSGHILFPALSSTGDGIITGLQLMAYMASTGQSLSQLAGVMTRFPQVLINVSVRDKRHIINHHDVQNVIRYAYTQLQDHGRVLLRPSGTEPLVRIMVEAKDHQLATDIANHIAGTITDIITREKTDY